MEVRTFGAQGEACAKTLRQVEACQLRGAEGKTDAIENSDRESKKVGKDWTVQLLRIFP